MVTYDAPPDVFTEACPTRRVLDRIADKWTVLVFGMLEDGPKRFSTLLRGIDGISQKMLTQTLRNLERDGIVTRTIYPEVPPRVEYNLTPLGETLCAPITMIRQWAEHYIGEVIQAQSAYDARRDGVSTEDV